MQILRRLFFFFGSFTFMSPRRTISFFFFHSPGNIIWRDSDLLSKNERRRGICHPIYGRHSDAQLFWCGDAVFFFFQQRAATNKFVNQKSGFTCYEHLNPALLFQRRRCVNNSRLICCLDPRKARSSSTDKMW